MTEQTQTADPVAALTGALERMTSTINDRFAALEARIPEPTPAPEPERDTRMLPGGQRGVDPSDTTRDPYTSGWWDDRLSQEDNERNVRANFEVVSLIQGASRVMRQPRELRFADGFMSAMRANLFEHRRFAAPRVLTDERGMNSRAMDSQETGYGLELIGVEYATQMWRAARNMDSLVSEIREIPMATSTMKVPIDGGVPEMLLVSENTSASATAYTTSKTPSSRVTLTAKKFTIQQRWSAELEEDSVIAFVPFLRDMLSMSAALHLGSAYYNGDETNAGTGNINTDDADPADTKHYLAWDGIRHYWLVDATGQGLNQAASLDPDNINVIRGYLNGGDDDVDNALTNINWGLNPRDLRLVMDWATYLSLLNSGKVTTVDKYGPQATIVTGELGSYAGIPIITPPYAAKTEADGKASTTEASNTKGQISLFNPRGFLGGMRRGTELFFDRVQGTDQFLFELYTRRAFTRFGSNVASGIYNITV